MATVIALAASAQDQGWKNRVKYLAVKASVDVMAESDQTVNHATRVALAKKILGGTFNFDVYALAVLTNATIAASGDPLATSDSDLEYTINSMYDAFASTVAV